VWDAWTGGPRLPRLPVVLSFDDGYADQVRDVLPVLRRARWPAC
jgi:peptidoglycan/xylan/chitin deacetylase (PgdA/CDA1 family)